MELNGESPLRRLPYRRRQFYYSKTKERLNPQRKRSTIETQDWRQVFSDIPDWGSQMHQLATDLFPICRSLTGNGVRQTLKAIQEVLPELTIHEVPSGTQVFDWKVPDEWNINDAYILDPSGEKIVDFKKCNLHAIGYSEPVNKKVSLAELKEHLYTKPDFPEAIPYIASFYKRRWGFCMSHQQYETLEEGEYQVYVDSTLEPGHLTYGELLIPGESEKEIFFSTYVCHPSMGNNELSGPMVTTFLAKYIREMKNRKYSYRFIFIPETIGSITYLSRNLPTLKERVIAGYNLSCVGDDNQYSYLPSRKGNTLSDRAAIHVLKHCRPEYKTYSFLDSGSDERRYGAPGVDLPIASIMRTRYGDYREYHTHLDDLDFISAEGLQGALDIYIKVIKLLEKNARYRITTLCEPQLGPRGLYPTISSGDNDLWETQLKSMVNFISYADGESDLIDIAETIQFPAFQVFNLIDQLIKHDLLEVNE